MKKFLLLCLFIIGVGFALFNFKGLANKGEYDSVVLNFREDIPTAVISQQLDALASKYKKTASLNSIFSVDGNVYTVSGDKAFITALRNSSLKEYVEYIEPNYIYSALEVPNDPDYSKQWNFRSINVEKAWDETQGEGITVAVIDTGVSRVPDLEETEFVEGYDFVNDKNDATDDNGHGTHVAGTIAQSTNNNYGVAGIAYKAKIMPLKVLSAGGGGTVADIAEAIRFAADHGADVINMSLGGGGESELMEQAIDYAYSKGVVIIAAAGNSGDNASSYPARYPKVISVAALDAAGNKASYSNFGAGVDISAPGGDELAEILQETIDPQTGKAAWVGLHGTSMASPHVAAVAALIKAEGISDPQEILEVLLQSSRKITEDPFNYYGAGQLDAAASVELAHKGKISLRHFFRWLRDNGYLSLRFWFDGGAVALMPKILMIVGSYLLAWFLRTYLPFALPLNFGLIMGSTGLFFLRGFYVFDLPQWPFRLMGSSIPELGSIIQGSPLLNPIVASVLIPFGLIALFLGHEKLKWFAIGTTLGVASCLAVSAAIDPGLQWIASPEIARIFLGINALLCFGLAFLASRGELKLS
ncbi:S8 family peptidase [Gloeothece verrucosa]|uniref:Peptidase S8 and S53 subtilisin kexin sedolisin n=1 Tax=Gloeothece verrucosa (strain PCC 7822) TaxID=497965 RepID=E0UB15_GLOV7|nr:S8 family peptidase [Gloeothece verrucosa]ADN16260.1 peptidase S8 and S53 subtilisin kexin sedolisin [Gloeothece verrucosa PCC 7822]